MKPLQVFQVIDGLEFWGNASMQGQEFIINEARNRQSIERLHEQFVCFLVILIQTLCAEVKELSHLSALVIASQHVNSLWEVKLE